MRQVHTLSGLGVQPLVSHRADHANHLVPGLVVLGRPKPDTLADRAFVGPIFAGQSFIDDRHLLRIRSVPFVEGAARHYGNSHGLKISGRRYSVLNHRGLAHRKHWEPFDREATTPAATFERNG